MTDEQTTRPNAGIDAPIDPEPLPAADADAEAAKVPLRDDVWKREGADAPDAADIEDPERQL